MIARLTGKLVLKSLEHLILDVSGVGYQVFVPLSTYYELPEQGETVSIHIYLNVRDDALLLYGFSSISEKSVFLKLIGINGIGPKLALSILSGISVSDLVTAIESQDVTKLTTIPGVGRKTAQRMALELKDKVTDIESAGHVKAADIKSEEVKMYDDVISALINLGYKKNAAENALRISLKDSGDERSLEKLLKTTLNILSKA
jgi:Holliday junction DNA helicase RuvA